MADVALALALSLFLSLSLSLSLSLALSLPALGFRAVRAHPPARERAAASLWRRDPPTESCHRGLGFTGEKMWRLSSDSRGNTSMQPLGSKLRSALPGQSVPPQQEGTSRSRGR